MMLEAVKKRFVGYQAPEPMELITGQWLPLHCQRHPHLRPRNGLQPCFTPGKARRATASRGPRPHPKARLSTSHAPPQR